MEKKATEINPPGPIFLAAETPDAVKVEIQFEWDAERKQIDRKVDWAKTSESGICGMERYFEPGPSGPLILFPDSAR
jgi:hypothetical protein